MKKVKKILSLLGVFAILTSVFPFYVLAETPQTDKYPLFAGKDKEIGYVEIIGKDIKYVVTVDGWCLMETHLDIENAIGDIPQTKKLKGEDYGNPIPGQFEYGGKHDCEREVAYENVFESVGNYYIAAHAAVNKYQEVCVDTSQTILSDENTLANGQASIQTWVHPAWISIPDAKWIWSSEFVANPRAGETVNLLREFNIVGTVESAKLEISSDNSFDVEINDKFVGQSLIEKNYNTVFDFDVKDFVKEGVNQLDIEVNNFPWNTDDPKVNPAGLVYKLAIDSQSCTQELVQSDSAWAATRISEERFVSKGSWATYVPHTIKGRKLIETVKVTPSGTLKDVPTPTYSESILSKEATYLLEAIGTYRFANWGSYGIADAAWNYRNPANAPGGLAGWYQQTSKRLQIWINNTAVSWQPTLFNPEHIYTLEISGTDNKIEFTIMDDVYVDNSGYITVNIYRVF
ncbi:MAG TPA: hypothetical protein PLX95_03605 [bacterium]|nr:hypothetical protein [bacterium]